MLKWLNCWIMIIDYNGLIGNVQKTHTHTQKFACLCKAALNISAADTKHADISPWPYKDITYQISQRSD